MQVLPVRKCQKLSLASLTSGFVSLWWIWRWWPGFGGLSLSSQWPPSWIPSAAFPWVLFWAQLFPPLSLEPAQPGSAFCSQQPLSWKFIKGDFQWLTPQPGRREFLDCRISARYVSRNIFIQKIPKHFSSLSVYIDREQVAVAAPCISALMAPELPGGCTSENQSVGVNLAIP